MKEKGLITEHVWLKNALVLLNEMVTLEGISISGMPQTFSPPDKKETWPYGVDDDLEIEELLKKMPATDILVSHNPPWQIGAFNGRFEEGSRSIFNHVLKNKPKLHHFGHTHEGRGVYTFEDSDTVFINTAVEKRVISPTVVVDFDKKSKDINGVYMQTSYQDQFDK